MLKTVRGKEINNLKISIIIPCRNEEKHINKCLDSIIDQDYPKENLEVLVIDGMSKDKTKKIIEDYFHQYHFIRYLKNPKKITPCALNIGIKNAKGEIIIRMDAHAKYKKDYISKCIKCLNDYNVDNVGGNMITLPIEDSLIGRSIVKVLTNKFGVGNSAFRIGSKEPKFVDTVFGGCYRREVFDRIGYFNEKLIRTQDREFNARLIEQGGKIILDPSVKCIYFPRTKFKDYCKWNYLGAFWIYYARRFTKTKMLSIRNFIPLLFIGWHLIGFVLSILSPNLIPFIFIPIVIYWSLVTFFSIKTAWKQKCLQIAPIMVILFGVTHYGYGIGGIIGLLKAILLGKDIQK